jgi:hypothetical protein
VKKNRDPNRLAAWKRKRAEAWEEFYDEVCRLERADETKLRRLMWVWERWDEACRDEAIRMGLPVPYRGSMEGKNGDLGPGSSRAAG